MSALQLARRALGGVTTDRHGGLSVVTPPNVVWISRGALSSPARGAHRP